MPQNILIGKKGTHQPNHDSVTFLHKVTPQLSLHPVRSMSIQGLLAIQGKNSVA
jgi:hypothetical protein